MEGAVRAGRPGTTPEARPDRSTFRRYRGRQRAAVESRRAASAPRPHPPARVASGRCPQLRASCSRGGPALEPLRSRRAAARRRPCAPRRADASTVADGALLAVVLLDRRPHEGIAAPADRPRRAAGCRSWGGAGPDCPHRGRCARCSRLCLHPQRSAASATVSEGPPGGRAARPAAHADEPAHQRLRPRERHPTILQTSSWTI